MILAILMILTAGIYRLLPHPVNVAPVAALALVGGMYFGRRYALWVPLVILAITDSILNSQMGYPIVYWPRLIDYGMFALIGLLGMWARTKSASAKTGCAIATPFLFFLASNFGVWLFGLNLTNQPYAKTWPGLVDCYTAALPFLRGTVIGDWMFIGLFVGATLVVQRLANQRLQWLVAEAKA